jgi:hypothetical protein
MGLTRGEFWSRIGLAREIDPLVTASYKFGAIMRQLQSDQGEDHADPWHLSFHGSQFPGDNPHACGRQSLYRMMDFARPMMPRWLEQVAESGKAIENSLVAKWYYAGYLVSPPSFLPGIIQEQYEDPDHWLTCTVDANVCWPRTTEPLICEVKSKQADVIQAMQRLIRGPDKKHVWQIKTEIALAHEAGPITKRRCFNTGRFAIMVGFTIVNGKIVGGREVCPQHGHDRCLREVTLSAPVRGYLYYVSRDNPEDTFEFMFEYDPTWLRVGAHQAQAAGGNRSHVTSCLPRTSRTSAGRIHTIGSGARTSIHVNGVTSVRSAVKITASRSSAGRTSRCLRASESRMCRRSGSPTRPSAHGTP